MEYIVDMQGFKQSDDDYILKELAIVPLHHDQEPAVFLFKNPFSWNHLPDTCKKQNLWLKKSFHGLSWSSGHFAYNTIGQILREYLHDAKIVYVHGSIKKQWLQRFKFNVCDFFDLKYPSINNVKCVTICQNHNGEYKNYCALHNVKRMKKIMITYKKKI